MKVEMKFDNAIKKVFISDEHSASSYGIPVAVVDGEAYGPNDFLPIWPDDELSWLVDLAKVDIAGAIKNSNLSADEIDFLHKFIFA